MSDIPEKFVKIISELSRFQKLPQPHKDEDDDFPLPRQLYAGHGKSIYISKKIDQLIVGVARTMRNGSSLKSQFSANDYIQLVRREIGPALAKIDLDADLNDNAQSVQADVEKNVSEGVDKLLNNGGQEYAFGCTLFTYDDIAPFEIGPVRFEPRLIWLERKSLDGCRARVTPSGRIERFGHQISDGIISKITKRRIIQTWQKGKIGKRKNSYDYNIEQRIIYAIGDCPYVCSVKIPGIGYKIGQDKALISARLALTTISLFWLLPSEASNGLNLPLFDQGFFIRHHVSFSSDGLIGYGSTCSNNLNAPFVPRDKLEENFKEYAPIFAIAGDAINWFLRPTADHARPKLLSIIAQAMIWFHNGCRETTDLQAIVCFASCMDILASGGAQQGICKLIHARLGIAEDAKIHRDGLTVKEVIKQIYDDGRNRFSHGPIDRQGEHVWEDKLGHDWSETRGIAEWLARQCLVLCMDWMVEHPTCDNPAQLLRTN